MKFLTLVAIILATVESFEKSLAWWQPWNEATKCQKQKMLMLHYLHFDLA